MRPRARAPENIDLGDMDWSRGRMKIRLQDLAGIEIGRCHRKLGPPFGVPIFVSLHDDSSLDIIGQLDNE